MDGRFAALVFGWHATRRFPLFLTFHSEFIHDRIKGGRGGGDFGSIALSYIFKNISKIFWDIDSSFAFKNMRLIVGFKSYITNTEFCTIWFCFWFVLLPGFRAFWPLETVRKFCLRLRCPQCFLWYVLGWWAPQTNTFVSPHDQRCHHFGSYHRHWFDFHYHNAYKALPLKIHMQRQ